jgi:group II intron reverse transcriptase/maturase
VNLITPQKVRKLQEALHAKAKGSPNFRFYALYDKLYREDVLEFAYRCCKANGGVAGVDRQTFEDIESYGIEQWLRELAEELRNRSYCPQAVLRVWIPKPNGQQRPLGIPSIKDRVVQTAAVLILSPIFEADLQNEQYAYRPNRGALDAVKEVRELIDAGHTEVVDADLSEYFDSIPHSQLIKSVARRISDRHVLRLIKMWLITPIEEDDEWGHRQRRNPYRKDKRGTPQGAPISPLLANIYMRRFVLAWKKLGHERRLAAYIVNYADDFVICCRGTAEQAAQAMRAIMNELRLRVNETKTRICLVPKQSIDFLGYTIGRCYRWDGYRYIGTRPSQKSVQRICRAISDRTAAKWTWQDEISVVKALNQRLTGWANYYRMGPVTRVYRAVDEHARYRLRWWLRRKHKVKNKGISRFSYEYLDQQLGLIRLAAIQRNLPCVKS